MRGGGRSAGVFFQMGFMRRFDAGYAAAKKQVQEGAIGHAVVFKSTSRDPAPHVASSTRTRARAAAA